MPTLTPIPLSVEEHQKLTSLKHKLEANSWREMLMKLCDIHEDYCQSKIDPPSTKDETTTEKPEEKKKETLFDLLLPSRKGNPNGSEQKMDEEDVRRIIREELGNWRIELPEHSHEPKEETEPCPSCGHQLSKTKKPQYCPNCDEELDWEEQE